MSIRIRTVNGTTVALCGYETDAMPGDIYLDDNAHYALTAKFVQDWQGRDMANWSEPWPEWAIMETQKLRDAETDYGARMG